MAPLMLSRRRPVLLLIGVLPALDPAAADHRVVLRIGGVHEVDGIALILAFLDRVVVLQERFLTLRIGLAGRAPGLLIGVTQAVEHHGHVAGDVAHPPALRDPACERHGRGVELGLKMGVQLRPLRDGEERFAADIGHPQQAVQTALLVALEVASHRAGIKQQSIGTVRHRATLAQENHGTDPVRLTHVSDLSVCAPQFGQLAFVQSAVRHSAQFIYEVSLLPHRPQSKFRL